MTMKEYYGIHKVARFATKKEMKDMSEWMYEYKGCMVMLAEYTPCGKKTCWVGSVWEETGNKRFPYNKLFEMTRYPHFTPDGLKICRRWAQECIDSMEA